MTKDEVLSRLKYIADSPSRKFGGFGAETIEVARGALEQLTTAEAATERRVADDLQKIRDWLMKEKDISRLDDYINLLRKGKSAEPKSTDADTITETTEVVETIPLA